MIAKEIKITNSNGDAIEFGRHFRLLEGFDLSSLNANSNYYDSTIDGANYQNTSLDLRDFDISFYIKKNEREQWWVEERRKELFRVFNPKFNPFKIHFTTKGGKSFYINANLNGTPSLPDGSENNNNTWQKGLLQFTANDPFIYSDDTSKTDIAVWESALEFPLELKEEGIEFGIRQQSLIVNVFNDGQMETGMIIQFKALGTLTNPSLINVNTYEFIKLNVTMQSGDLIEVSTYDRNKKIELFRNGEKTNALKYLDLQSTFLKLNVGDNLFRYDADTNLNNLEISIKHHNTYVGV